MSYHDKLVAEINGKLDALAAAGEAWRAAWITQAICEDHKDGLAANEDAAFWRWCTHEEVRDQVRTVINKRAGPREAAAPMLPFLDGYEEMQPYYVVKRDGEDTGVSVFDLTDEEIDAKAHMHRSMGKKNLKHARELERFKHDDRRRRAMAI